MNEMIERVARASDPLGWSWYDRAEDEHPAKPVFRKRAFAQAGAAIEAMRKVTKTMYDAGGEFIGDTTDGHWIDIDDLWGVMINAALKD